MKPLRVALVVKNVPGAWRREDRGMGMWSYYVPQFTWEHLSPGKDFFVDTRKLKAQGFDLVFHEDGGNWGRYTGHAIPVLYYAIDSTLSEEYHYRPRRQQAGQSDLILVDHDELARFKLPGHRDPIRLPYCVNDKLFKPAHTPGRYDVNFNCGGDELGIRAGFRSDLQQITQRHGWSYHSGTLPLNEYADLLAQHKVVVNVPRNPQNRPHRIFDTMACRVALLTMSFPNMFGDEEMCPGVHFSVFFDTPELEHRLESLMENDRWKLFGQSGYEVVKAHHTWEKRAAELRSIIQKELHI